MTSRSPALYVFARNYFEVEESDLPELSSPGLPLGPTFAIQRVQGRSPRRSREAKLFSYLYRRPLEETQHLEIDVNGADYDPESQTCPAPPAGLAGDTKRYDETWNDGEMKWDAWSD